MLLARLVDNGAWQLHAHGYIDFVASCRGYEAAQVGSAMCIEVGKDFTLPSYRDLGVVLTIGMTPYEVFRTYLRTPAGHHTKTIPSVPHDNHQAKQLHIAANTEDQEESQEQKKHPAMLHWGYHKHNTVTGPARTATQILHAAGIAFASKLRKQSVVTVAYCDTAATLEPDFLEGIRFAAHHQLPVIFICEQDADQERLRYQHPQREDSSSPSFTLISCLTHCPLPKDIHHQCIDGGDVVEVYLATQEAMQQVRKGRGPVLLEMHIPTPAPISDKETFEAYITHTNPQAASRDPLLRCQRLLQEQGAWDETWARELFIQYSTEIERASYDAQQDIR